MEVRSTFTKFVENIANKPKPEFVDDESSIENVKKEKYLRDVNATLKRIYSDIRLRTDNIEEAKLEGPEVDKYKDNLEELEKLLRGILHNGADNYKAQGVYLQKLLAKDEVLHSDLVRKYKSDRDFNKKVNKIEREGLEVYRETTYSKDELAKLGRKYDKNTKQILNSVTDNIKLVSNDFVQSTFTAVGESVGGPWFYAAKTVFESLGIGSALSALKDDLKEKILGKREDLDFSDYEREDLELTKTNNSSLEDIKQELKDKLNNPNEDVVSSIDDLNNDQRDGLNRVRGDITRELGENKSLSKRMLDQFGLYKAYIKGRDKIKRNTSDMKEWLGDKFDFLLHKLNMKDKGEGTSGIEGLIGALLGSKVGKFLTSALSPLLLPVAGFLKKGLGKVTEKASGGLTKVGRFLGLIPKETKSSKIANGLAHLEEKVPFRSSIKKIPLENVTISKAENLVPKKGFLAQVGEEHPKFKPVAEAVETGKSKVSGFLDKINPFKGSTEVLEEGAKLTEKEGAKVAEKVGAKVAEKEGVKVAEKVAAKVAAEAVGKTALKGLGKSASKLIPGVGLAIGLGFAGSRLSDKDYLGASLEAVSATASLIPGVGTAVSLLVDGVLAIKDVGTEAISKFMDYLAEKIKGVGSWIGKMLAKIPELLAYAFTNLLPDLVGLLKDVFKSLSLMLFGLIRMVLNGLGSIFKEIPGLEWLGDAFFALSKVVQDLATALIYVAEWVWDLLQAWFIFMSELTKAVWGYIADALKAVAKFFVDIGVYVWNGLKSIGSIVWNWFTNLVSQTSNWFSNLLSSFADFGKKILVALGLDSVLTYLTDIGKKIYDLIVGTFGGMFDWLGKKLKDFWNWLSSWVPGIKKAEEPFKDNAPNLSEEYKKQRSQNFNNTLNQISGKLEGMIEVGGVHGGTVDVKNTDSKYINVNRLGQGKSDKELNKAIEYDTDTVKRMKNYTVQIKDGEKSCAAIATGLAQQASDLSGAGVDYKKIASTNSKQIVTNAMQSKDFITSDKPSTGALMVAVQPDGSAHTGIVTGVNSNGSIATMEGNTSLGGTYGEASKIKGNKNVKFGANSNSSGNNGVIIGRKTRSGSDRVKYYFITPKELTSDDVLKEDLKNKGFNSSNIFSMDAKSSYFNTHRTGTKWMDDDSPEAIELEKEKQRQQDAYNKIKIAEIKKYKKSKPAKRFSTKGKTITGLESTVKNINKYKLKKGAGIYDGSDDFFFKRDNAIALLREYTNAVNGKTPEIAQNIDYYDKNEYQKQVDKRTRQNMVRFERPDITSNSSKDTLKPGQILVTGYGIETEADYLKRQRKLKKPTKAEEDLKKAKDDKEKERLKKKVEEERKRADEANKKLYEANKKKAEEEFKRKQKLLEDGRKEEFDLIPEKDFNTQLKLIKERRSVIAEDSKASREKLNSLESEYLSSNKRSEKEQSDLENAIKLEKGKIIALKEYDKESKLEEERIILVQSKRDKQAIISQKLDKERANLDSLVAKRKEKLSTKDRKDLEHQIELKRHEIDGLNEAYSAIEIDIEKTKKEYYNQIMQLRATSDSLIEGINTGELQDSVDNIAKALNRSAGTVDVWDKAVSDLIKAQESVSLEMRRGIVRQVDVLGSFTKDFLNGKDVDFAKMLGRITTNMSQTFIQSEARNMANWGTKVVDSGFDAVFGKEQKDTSEIEKLGRNLTKEVTRRSITDLITKGSIDATSILKDVKRKGINGIVDIGVKGVKTFLSDILGLNPKKKQAVVKDEKGKELKGDLRSTELEKQEALKNYKVYMEMAENASGEDQKNVYLKAAEEYRNIYMEADEKQKELLENQKKNEEIIKNNRAEIDDIKKKYNIENDDDAIVKFEEEKQKKKRFEDIYKTKGQDFEAFKKSKEFKLYLDSMGVSSISDEDAMDKFVSMQESQEEDKERKKFNNSKKMIDDYRNSDEYSKMKGLLNKELTDEDIYMILKKEGVIPDDKEFPGMDNTESKTEKTSGETKSEEDKDYKPKMSVDTAKPGEVNLDGIDKTTIKEKTTLDANGNPIPFKEIKLDTPQDLKDSLLDLGDSTKSLDSTIKDLTSVIKDKGLVTAGYESPIKSVKSTKVVTEEPAKYGQNSVQNRSKESIGSDASKVGSDGKIGRDKLRDKNGITYNYSSTSISNADRQKELLEQAKKEVNIDLKEKSIEELQVPYLKEKPVKALTDYQNYIKNGGEYKPTKLEKSKLESVKEGMLVSKMVDEGIPEDMAIKLVQDDKKINKKNYIDTDLLQPSVTSSIELSAPKREKDSKKLNSNKELDKSKSKKLIEVPLNELKVDNVKDDNDTKYDTNSGSSESKEKKPTIKNTATYKNQPVSLTKPLRDRLSDINSRKDTLLTDAEIKSNKKEILREIEYSNQFMGRGAGSLKEDVVSYEKGKEYLDYTNSYRDSNFSLSKIGSPRKPSNVFTYERLRRLNDSGSLKEGTSDYDKYQELLLDKDKYEKQIKYSILYDKMSNEGIYDKKNLPDLVTNILDNKTKYAVTTSYNSTDILSKLTPEQRLAFINDNNLKVTNKDIYQTPSTDSLVNSKRLNVNLKDSTLDKVKKAEISDSSRLSKPLDKGTQTTVVKKPSNVVAVPTMTEKSTSINSVPMVSDNLGLIMINSGKLM